MKNIFLKETEQKSKLYRNLLTDKLFILEGKVTDVSECNREYHFIYVTNDETIKEGDWIYHSLLKGGSIIRSKYNNPNTTAKKIVLTNDPSLIADGVQEVSSSFLSFYAENTPDYVRVEKWLDDEGKRFYSLDFSPKKELKTEENIIDQWLEKNGNPEIMKQVEREAEELEWQHFLNNEGYHDKESNDIWKIGCLDGAIWQKSRMYSEQEVIALIHRFNYDLVNSNIETFKEWFEEHKKQ